MRMNIKVFLFLGAVLIGPAAPVGAADVKTNRHHSITNTGDCLDQEGNDLQARSHAGYLPKAYARCLEQSRKTHRKSSEDEKPDAENTAEAGKSADAPRKPHNYYRIINKAPGAE